MNKTLTKPRVAIGPLILQKSGYGGVQNHIRSIMRYSACDLTPITPLFSSYSQYLRPASSLLTTKEASFLDVYGLIYSKLILPNYDIVHLHGHPEWPGLYFKPDDRRAKYVHTVHGIYTREDYPDEWRYRSMLNDRLVKSCRESDVVIAVAQWLQEWLQQRGVDALYIPNGINIEEFRRTAPDDFTETYNITDDFYLFAGRLDEYKRPRLFIQLAERLPGKTCVMVGRDLIPNKVGEYYGKKLPDNLVCLGELPRKDLVNAFSACRVFVLTSKYDTFPTVLLEAMTCEKVVVGANNAGPKEMIDDGVDGFLFEPDDLDDLEKAAVRAWEHPELGKHGHAKVMEHFEWSVVVQKIDEVYVNVI